MITKEIARLIHNCYTEIESGEKMIEELKKSINEKGEFELTANWTGRSQGLELNIPNKNSAGSYSVHNVPPQVGLMSLKAHIENNKKELERLKIVCLTQLA